MDSSDTKSSEKHPKNRIERRTFLKRTAAVAGGLTCAASAGLLYTFLKPNVVREIPPRFRAGPPDDFQSNSAVYIEDYRLFVVRDSESGFYALSSVCTHLGCLVNWLPDASRGYMGGRIACPCHGTLYSPEGNVLSGPAPRALDRYHIELEEGQLVIDTTVTVEEAQMVLKI